MVDLHGELEGVLGQDTGSHNDSLPAYSDEALAQRYTKAFKREQRWLGHWGRWLIWNDGHWQDDNTALAIYRARQIVECAAGEYLADRPNASNAAEKIASAKTIHAIERLARSSREFATVPSDLDADLWLLNTPENTVDLRTGQVRPHNPDDLITKVTAVSPGGACPRWLAFLNETFGGDRETVDFIQRLLGYSLTGACSEHILAFFYGTGGNGKGVLLNTVYRILGSYSATASMETFTSSPYERHTTDLAMLRGCRLVLAQETDDGQRWAEAKIKRLTGGDAVTARFMRQDNFTYMPQFTLLIAGNHKPTLRNVDEAIRRRLLLIPCNHTVPADRRDPDLTEALEAEWPGILEWLIEGCLAWQQAGLAPSDAVRDATSGYLKDEDSLGRFLDERCECSGFIAGHETPTQTIYEDWNSWCQSAGEYSGSAKKFSQKLAERGYERIKHPKTRASMFLGLRLKTTGSS